MTNAVKSLVAAGAAALSFTAPAESAVLDFEGNMIGRGVVGASPACAPRFRGTIDAATSAGTSTLGAFTYSHIVCTPGQAGGVIDGTFSIDFGGDGFTGTLVGLVTPTAMPPLSALDILFTIGSGTGRFLGATGTFTGIGTADPRVGPSIVQLAFDGAIDAPAVPEPQAWALLILGFGVVGASLRKRSLLPTYA